MAASSILQAPKILLRKGSSPLLCLCCIPSSHDDICFSVSDLSKLKFSASCIDQFDSALETLLLCSAVTSQEASFFTTHDDSVSGWCNETSRNVLTGNIQSTANRAENSFPVQTCAAIFKMAMFMEFRTCCKFEAILASLAHVTCFWLKESIQGPQINTIAKIWWRSARLKLAPSMWHARSIFAMSPAFSNLRKSRKSH